MDRVSVESPSVWVLRRRKFNIMKNLKNTLAVIALTIVSIVANAQDGKAVLMNGNHHFFGAVKGGVISFSESTMGEAGIEAGWTLGRWQLGAEYGHTFGKDEEDRSHAGLFGRFSLVGNPNAKVRPYVGLGAGMGSQPRYSYYGTAIDGKGTNYDVNVGMVTFAKDYNWNFQCNLGVKLDFIISRTVTLAAYANVIYNPNEGDLKEIAATSSNMDLPQGWEISTKTDLEQISLDADKIGFNAGVTISFRF